MNTALKSICFFAFSVIFGNWLSQYLAFQTLVELTMESWFTGNDALFARLLFSGVFSLPILIPIVLLFGHMKTYRPYYPLNIVISMVLGLMISLLWSLILTLLFDWFRNIEAWGAFAVGAMVAAGLTETLSTLAHKANVNSSSNQANSYPQ